MAGDVHKLCERKDRANPCVDQRQEAIGPSNDNPGDFSNFLHLFYELQNHVIDETMVSPCSQP